MPQPDQTSTEAMVEFIRTQLDDDERWALEASRLKYGGEVVSTGVHWHWECGDGDEELTPDPMLDEFLECPTHESVSVALRSREEYETSYVGRLSQHAMPTVEEVSPAVAGHVARHDPARALAQVAAHRAILDRYELCKREGERNRALHEAWVDAGGSEMGDGAMPDDPAARARRTSPFEEAGLLVAVQLLATMYAGRDGWREAWRPE